jgi:hypothetical protein
MTRRRKILLTLAACLGGLVLALAIAVAIIGRDEASFNDSDLAVHRPDVPDAENGYSYFLQAGDIMYWVGSDAWTQAGLHPEIDTTSVDETESGSETPLGPGTQLEYMAEGRNWYPTLAAEVLEHNAQTLALVEKGLACRQSVAPKMIGMNFANFPTFNFLRIADILELKSLDLARSGQGEAALDQAVDIVRFGHSVEHAQGVIINALVGTTVKQVGLRAVRRQLRDSTLSPDFLKRTAARLGEWTDSSNAFANTFCAEYEWSSELYRTMPQNLANAVLSPPGPGAAGSPRPFAFQFGVVYKPEETCCLAAETLRTLKDASIKPFSQTRETVSLLAPQSQPSLLGEVIGGNIVGRRLHRAVFPALAGILRMKSRIQTESAATRALVALKAFKAATGRLPQTLDELMPAYLPAVPLDDFDGQPIRYSPQKGIVYSVGENLKDDGGMTRDEARQWWMAKNFGAVPPEDTTFESWDQPDMSYPIEF